MKNAEYSRLAGFVWLQMLARHQNLTYKLFCDIYGSVEAAWNGNPEELCGVEGINERFIENFKNNAIREAAVKLTDKTISTGIGMVCVEDDGFPERMKTYDGKPLLLYYFGNIGKLNSSAACLGVVGSRNCSLYGRDVTRRLVSELKENNIAVISGMARGVDSVAHRAALDNDIFTAAVLGCGVNVVYPAENVGIYKAMCESGLVLSELPPDTQPFKSNFPARNRIIAAMSDAVLVTEAGLSSGALITADFALDCGREVLAVPQRIDVPTGGGCNSLIKNGAACVTCSGDVFSALNIEIELAGTADALPESLNESESVIYRFIKAAGSCDENTIIQKCRLEIGVVKRSLSALEIYGFIKRISNGEFTA